MGRRVKKIMLSEQQWYTTPEGEVWVTAKTPSGHEIGLCLCERGSPEAVRLNAGESVTIGKRVLYPSARRLPEATT